MDNNQTETDLLKTLAKEAAKLSLACALALEGESMAPFCKFADIAGLDVSMLVNALTELKKSDTRHMQTATWQQTLLADLFPDRRDEMLCPKAPQADIIWRLMQCASSMPTAGMYRALMWHYDYQYGQTGIESQTLPPRLAKQPMTNISEHTEKLMAMAMHHLKVPSRLDYILTGKTQLKQDLSREAVEALYHINVYVPVDFSHISDEDLLGMPSRDLAILDEIYQSSYYKLTRTEQERRKQDG